MGSQKQLRLLQGYTIVELLLVIVVVAILAAVVTVSYQGVQQRAENTKTKALVRQWEISMRLFQATNEKLPNDWTCLGQTVDDFPEIASKAIEPGQCERNMVLINPSPDWTSEFKTVPTAGQTQPTYRLLSSNATLSSGLLKMYTYGTNAYIRGIIYASIFEPERAPAAKPGAFIFYVLKDEACPADRVYRTLDSLHVCALRLTTDNYAGEVFQPA